jgi:catechol 2,3-dioxygenase-like lactoylglutathione lyase family enzyme
MTSGLQILETCLYVDDLVAAENFYRDVLGLKMIRRKSGRHVFFQCGQSMLLIFDPRATDRSGSRAPPHGAIGDGHIAFAVPDDDLPQWRKRLTAHEVAIERHVDWPQGGHSLYFRDPAGNSLELASPRIWGIQIDKAD